LKVLFIIFPLFLGMNYTYNITLFRLKIKVKIENL